MKMHVIVTATAMFFVSGTAFAQSSVHNPHAWGNEAALATTAQEPRIAREAGTGLTETVQEPAKRGVRETDTIGEKTVVRANPHQ